MAYEKTIKAIPYIDRGMSVAGDPNVQILQKVMEFALVPKT